MIDTIERHHGKEAARSVSLVWGDIQRLLGKLWLQNKPRLVNSLESSEKQNLKMRSHNNALMFLAEKARADRHQIRE